MTTAKQPTVVMVVVNDVSGDTRVKKTAVTLAHAGCSVVVYGFSKSARRWETVIGPVRVVRLPDPRKMPRSTHVSLRERRFARRRSQDPLERASARREARRARVVASVRIWKGRIDRRQYCIDGRGSRSLADRLVIASLWYRIKGLRAIAKVPDLVFRLRLARWGRRGKTRKLVTEIRRWLEKGIVSSPGSTSRRTSTAVNALAHLEPLGQALLEELRGQEVDAIHAHDFFAIGMAHKAATLLSKPDAPVRLVYDAHEYVRGLDVLAPERQEAALELEEEHIHSADRVITVTPELADRLQEDYHLPRRPDVVLNAPALLDGRSSRESVRSRLGLADDVPLLVYAGQVKAARDIHTLVAALGFLPSAHLAILTANTGPYLEELADIATRNSATDRYHVLPYVASHEVSGFLRDATLGVVPLTHYGNAELALPTKLFEFLHAGLPMAVSDTQAMRRFVIELGVGEVFTAGDPRSLVAAVDKVLGRLDSYRQLLLADPEVLARYSWQRQEQVLIDAYSSLLDRSLSWDGRTPTSLQEDAVLIDGAETA